MAIKIKQEKKVKNKGEWLHLVKVCNDGKTDQKVVVTSWPYGPGKPLGPKIGKKKDRPEQTRTIKAGKCEWFVFEFKTEPVKSYTDVFDADKYDPQKQSGGLLDYTLNQDLLVSKLPKSESGNGNYLVTTQLPYPNRFAYLEESMDFYIESISGIPNDWEYELLQPKLGEVFTLEANDREYPAVISLKAPADLQEGTVIQARMVQRIVGMADEPCYVMRHDLVLAVDETGPELDSSYLADVENGTISVQATAEDTVTGVREVVVNFSTDGGATWAYKQLTAPLEAYTTDGPNPTNFATEIGPFRESGNVLVQVTATDEVGNVSRTENVAVNLRQDRPSSFANNANPC